MHVRHAHVYKKDILYSIYKYMNFLNRFVYMNTNPTVILTRTKKMAFIYSHRGSIFLTTAFLNQNKAPSSKFSNYCPIIIKCIIILLVSCGLLKLLVHEYLLNLKT